MLAAAAAILRVAIFVGAKTRMGVCACACVHECVCVSRCVRVCVRQGEESCMQTVNVFKMEKLHTHRKVSLTTSSPRLHNTAALLQCCRVQLLLLVS
jgi:hypothetical protein